MPGFADSFWSGDYAAGLGVLFEKLQQGIVENQQVLTIAKMRAVAEDTYSQKMGEIVPATEKLTGGFAKDDGASVRKAYEGVRGEMEEASKNHRKIASNIRELVVIPFGRWCDAHEARIANSQNDLQARVKAHDKQSETVRKLRSHYFNKCRLVEDLEEENKLAFQDPQSDANPPNQIPTVKLPEEDDPEEPEPIDIGDETYGPEQVKKILTSMLESIKQGDVKVPILGTYQNVSTGADIVEYIQKNLNATSVSYAERIGQDLVANGFLRLVGNVGNTFANSSRMHYQWRPKVYQMTGVPDRKRMLDRVSSIMLENPDSPVAGTVGEYLAGWNPLNNPHPNETPGDKLRREAREADDRYKIAVRKLDALRCNLEEAMMDHLKFMERCELDRLKAIKAVVLDFSGAISNVIPSLQSTVDNMMLYQETVQPLADLRYLLENYRTGPFIPKVQVYENYYNSVDEQTFGVDLEARARADRKRVPIIVTTILTYLDEHYPDLEGDEARRGIWLVDVPLAATHHLRNVLNTGKAIPRDVLEQYEIPVIASVLKLYLLELPDSLVSSHVYEIVKTIYSTTASETSESTRISVIQNTLGQLRLANIATLDAIMTHFTRLIELTSADEAVISALAQSLAPCVLRPRVSSSLTMNERHSYRLIRDLFAHKDAIFGELKRASTLKTGPTRARAVSTDESNRRVNMEARNRAIASRSRGSSPAAGIQSMRHRRDRSSGGVEGRFPINPASPPTLERVRTTRSSLGIPGSNEGSPVGERSSLSTMRSSETSPPPSWNGTDGAAAALNGTAENPDVLSSPTSTTSASTLEKRDSLGRSTGLPSSARFSRKTNSLQRQSLTGSLGKRDSVGSIGSATTTTTNGPTASSTVATEASDRPVGVELKDAPMDD
ncbi:rho-GTPase-activating protein-like protein [Xylona heveae TC161]|uniref:Rho-GTPase-activating protein-like protein n=1 Tax=Xylona heveae (strain CBS 132557 / TC161) TaxID=1328760 RepID=A0A165K1Y9_XYLHT|nr:rho-GTPase-activating protein-like protein [Xylona heveae TC161]KZF26895.1 rho-GTPase-activating protein-like protein [Xylona heveae TC161]